MEKELIYAAISYVLAISVWGYLTITGQKGIENFKKVFIFIRNFFKREKFVVVHGFIEDAYIISDSSDLYCVEIKGIHNKKLYLVSMKSEHLHHYETFLDSKGDHSIDYKILCRKKFLSETEFVRML